MGEALALRRIAVSGREGILDQDVEKSIRNLGLLGNDGMAVTDQVILGLMARK